MTVLLRGTIPLALCLILSACTSTKQPFFAGPNAEELTELNILTTPVGLDLDGRPGLDGFSVKVYANVAEKPKPVSIRSGSLEIVMFDGSLHGRTNLPPPLRVWSFTVEQLRANEFTARIGTGYDLVLLWGTNVPTRQLITVGARYTSPQGKVITSSLSSVTVIGR